jgi:hypothetical protein
MADAGWDLGETIFIGANDEGAANATGVTRRDAEEGFYNFLITFRDANNTFVYRYDIVGYVIFSFLFKPLSLQLTDRRLNRFLKRAFCEQDNRDQWTESLTQRAIAESVPCQPVLSPSPLARRHGI